MKRNLKTLLYLLSMSVLLWTSCSKNENPVVVEKDTEQEKYLKSLNEYKKSDHSLMFAYYRTWRDIATDPTQNQTSMKDLPDSLDLVFVFPDFTPEGSPYWDSLRTSYVPYLRERGTKVIMTAGINALLNKEYANNEDGYKQLAKKLYEDNVAKFNLDGFDIDFEQSLSKEEQERAIGVTKALSQYMGPKSKTGKLLIYDTNRDGTNTLFEPISEYLDYILVQSYGRSSSDQSLQNTFNTYASFLHPSKYLIGFYSWNDTNPILENSRAYAYAKWQPTQGKKGGIFSYAVDRDGIPDGENRILKPTYEVTKQLISTMNPPKK